MVHSPKTARVIPLGIDPDIPGETAIIDKMIEYLNGQPDGTRVLLLGRMPIEQHLLAYVARNVKTASLAILATNTYYEQFNRPCGIERLSADGNYDLAMSLSHPSLYAYDAKIVNNFARGRPPLVLPLARFPASDIGDRVAVSLGPDAPIVFSTWQWAGSGRARPVVTALFSHIGLNPTPMPWLQTNNRRFIERSVVLPGEGTFFPRGTVPSRDIDAFHGAGLELMDRNHWVEMHTTLSSRVAMRHADLRYVYLVRDPRDIVVSLYNHILTESSENDLAEIKNLPPEGGLRVVMDGFDYVGPNRDFFHRQPSIEEMAGWFLDMSRYENAFVLRFEDVRTRPMETYRSFYA